MLFVYQKHGASLTKLQIQVSKYLSIFNKKYPWSIDVSWKLYKKGQYYLTQSVSINKRIERCLFFLWKQTKSPGADEINFNVIQPCFGELCGPLKYLFDLSLESWVFPDLMKIAIVSPVFKTVETADINNYRPISVLPCFSKILERVIYNLLHK